MKTTLQKLWAPPTCETCPALVKEIPSLCHSCRTSMQRLQSHCDICAVPFESSTGSEHRCAECIRQLPSFDKVTSVFDFSGPIISLLHALKFGRRLELAHFLATESVQEFSKVI